MNRTPLLYLVVVASLAAYPNGSRIPAGNAGEPGSRTPCSSCHTATLNPSGGSVALTLPGGNTFTPGVSQRWSIAVTDANASLRKGFQMTASSGTFAPAASIAIVSSGGKQYVSQSAAGTSWSVDWTPPANVESVTVYLAGLAASGTRQGNVYTASVTLDRAATTVPRPAISSAGVVNGATFAPGISPGSWVTIFGTNLAPAGVARSWTSVELASGTLPTTLDGTSVRINGKPAAVAYVSETQLNVQAPADDTRGNVGVEVTTAAGSSTAVVAQLNSVAPGLFRFQPRDYRYVAAVHANGALLAPADLLEGGPTPAKPGETILLFGTGFGATTLDVAPGTLFSGAAPLAAGNALSIRIGGAEAQVQFAGMSATGLYQFNLVVPDLPDGDHAVEVSAWGTSVSTQQYLPIKR